jgi:hypothetical protein
MIWEGPIGELGEQDSAIFYFRKSLVLNPDFKDAAMAVGRLYVRQEEIGRFEALFFTFD